jgi:hypothetical protein
MLHRRYLHSLLGCQGEEKVMPSALRPSTWITDVIFPQPSVQKLVSSVANDCMSLINENTMHSEAYTLETPRLDDALRDLENEFSEKLVDKELLDDALHKGKLRSERRNRIHHETVRFSGLLLPTFMIFFPPCKLGYRYFRDSNKTHNPCESISQRSPMIDSKCDSGVMSKCRSVSSLTCFAEITL